MVTHDFAGPFIKDSGIKVYLNCETRVRYRIDDESKLIKNIGIPEVRAIDAIAENTAGNGTVPFA